MAMIRLIIFLTVAVAIIILLVQNLSPSLPIMFLGMRTQSFSLGLWILLSIAAGILTSLIITRLLKFTNYLTSQEQQPISKSIPTAPRVTKNTPPPSSPPPQVNQFDDEFDDWDTNQDQDDWDSGEDSQAAPRTSVNKPNYQDGSRPSSVYSYSSQEPKNTAVGKTESIYDADYRVIIPPYQESSKNQANDDDDDDWDFFEDDDENKP